MKKCAACFIIPQFFSLLLFASNSFGQMAPADSISRQNSIDRTVSDFYLAIGQQSRLYNGHEYVPYDPHIKGNALYPPDAQTWATGEVTYDGIIYKSVPLKYDIYKDVLIALLYNHFSSYMLVNEKVHDFGFSGHHFVRINADSLVNDKSGITTGFYDRLYGGKTEVLAKRSKSIQHSTDITIILETYFIEKDDYYVKKGNTYYNVGSKSSFLKVFKDKKAALQQYMRDNHINFSENREVAMAALASYYDQISN